MTVCGWIALAGACSSTTRVAVPVELPNAADRTPPVEGWRWESSRGIEVAVPGDWAINDSGCNQTDAPSVVRGKGSSLDCLTFEPLTKQIVEIIPDEPGGSPPEGAEIEDVTIDDQPAQRAVGETPDGRAAGWLHIPGLHVLVRARVRDDEMLQRILDSVRVVDVDHNGCAAARADLEPTAPTAKTLLPTHSNALSVCFYGGGEVLESSALLEGDAHDAVIALLDGAKSGRNPDVPANRCSRTDEVPPADLVLVAHAASEHAAAEVWFSGCTHRGISNGRTTVQLSIAALDAIMKPLHRGYGYNPSGLPKR